MRKIILPLLAVSIGFISCKKEEEKTEATPSTETEVKVEETVEATPDSATVAKAWADYATPSKAHEMLA